MSDTPSSPRIELDLERAAPPEAKPQPEFQQAPMGRPYAPPLAPVMHPLVESSYRTAALRAAGAILLLDIGLAAWLLGQGGSSGILVGSLVVDGVIAPMLLLGKDSVRKWALVRSVLGLLIGSVLVFASAPDTPYAWVAAALNAIYCGGLILLLAGEELGLPRLLAGSALSSLSLCAILASLVFVQSALNQDPTPQSAFGGRFSVLGFKAFTVHPHDLSPANAAKFDEFGVEQALSPAGMETIWLYHPKPGITMDPGKALKGAFRGFQTGAGVSPTDEEPRAESHGSLDGEGLKGTIVLKGRALQAHMFVSEQNGAVWIFLVLLPERRDPALADRILDSIQINA